MKIVSYRILGFLTLILLLNCSSVTNPEPPKETSHSMTMITPASQWREGLPSGNGTVGALVYGAIYQERVLFNHNKLWYGGKTDDLPDLSAELPVVRALMLNGDYLKANKHYSNKLKQAGFSAKAGRFHPAFDLLLTTENEFMFQDYSRTLNFETGEVAVNWRDGETKFSRRLFVSIPDNVSVMSIQADKKNAISGKATLDIHDLNDAIDREGNLFDPGFKYITTTEGEFVKFKSTGSDGGEFGGVMRVLTKGGAVHTESKSISFDNTDTVTLIISFFANEDSEIAFPRLKKELLEINTNYETLFNRHKALHSERFNAMGVHINQSKENNTPNELLLLEAYQGDISTELNQKQFDYGRYLLISSSRGGGYPANLQGIWNGDYRPPWNSFYGINENLQMNYLQGLPGNLKESMMAFYDYFDANMDEFRTNAKQLYGTRGIFIPPFMSPESAKLRVTAPHVIYWTDAAGWLASFYYDYYLFTGDEEFLKNRAIPFMKEVGLFYEDFIVKDKQGKNMFFPSQSPENQPIDKTVIDPETGRLSKIKVQMNATIAVAVSKEVFTNLIASCELLGIEKDGVSRWKNILEAMPDYQINEDGALSEWMHPDFKDNYEHRHQSHIYPLFPGHEFSQEKTPELYKASKVAIEKRLRIGLKSQTGWSLAHMANVYARLGNGQKAKEALDILVRSCLGKNLFTYHNDWRNMGVTVSLKNGNSAPFQIDANMGITAAVTEMLCGSDAKMLRILPALPSEWAKGNFHDMLTRVGVKTSVEWDMNEHKITITLVAERDTQFDLKFSKAPTEINCNTEDVIKESSFGKEYRLLNLNKGQEIKLNVTI
ncbi:glycoside hydrolase family 95 protein [Tamlana agarivorans]|uniref:Glycoside hydrolase family 95 protein n=1 Tax=Pseudotamlana agarivorans TaxID=481183 RepID=A0ACC5U9F4_9FLAO|nr:glycoside hydrolase family 95 protein [Tamlana agarivorans]MBU2950949.1 glycoside hydrolase family 95 protein [Tamlana agarivorans]